MIERDFVTRDVWLSAFLYALGASPSLKKDGRDILFSFPQSSELDTLIRNYHSNTSMPIGDYVRAAKTLRGRMTSAKYENRDGGR